jgi:RNA polymerase sigma factor (TIGR02999 family)
LLVSRIFNRCEPARNHFDFTGAGAMIEALTSAFARAAIEGSRFMSASRRNVASGVGPGTRDPDELVQIVYDELRRLAAGYLRRERPGQTLQTTALVHEAYLRLAQSRPVWTDRHHFVGIAARAMRQILVERARARGARKRWGGMNRVTLSETLVAAAAEDAILPALDEALRRLEQIDPEQARMVELRYFVGLSAEETAETLKVSLATYKRRWALARAWLFRELERGAR